MWKPDESLDDFIVKPETDSSDRPPRAVRLRRTDEVEILRPIAGRETPRLRRSPNIQPLWFRRMVAAGSGALAVCAFVLISAILIGISEPNAGPDVAMIGQPEDKPAQILEPFDIFSATSFPPVTALNILRSNARRMPTRSKVRLTNYKPIRPPRPTRQLAAEPKFVPTTLVIYAENGVINTRIEPWLQADFKRPTLNN